MAQDDKMNEKGDSTSLRKAPSSVVDDFLQALFARHPPPVSEEEIGEAKIATPNQEEQQQQHSTTATGAERDRSPDEFDEYEMLSKRKDQNIFDDGSKPPMAAAQRRELKVGKPEIHMVARRLPPSIKKRDLLDHFSKYGTILDAYVLNASGHVQFDNAESCQTAVQEENGKILKGAVLGRFYFWRVGRYNDTCVACALPSGIYLCNFVLIEFASLELSAANELLFSYGKPIVHCCYFHSGDVQSGYILWGKGGVY